MAGASDAWTVVETRFNPASAKAYEGLFTLGSGYLHVRGSLEEHLPDQPQNVEYERRAGNVTSEKFREVLAQWGTYVPGVFAKHPTLNNQMVNLPWPLGFSVEVDGEKLNVLNGRVLEYRRELSLRSALLSRRVVWQSARGVRVTAEWERFVSATRPELILQRLKLAADKTCSAQVVGDLDADVRTNGFAHFRGAGCNSGDGWGRLDLFVEDGTAPGSRVDPSSVPTQTGIKGTMVHMRARMSMDDVTPAWELRASHTHASCGVHFRGELAPGVMCTFHKRTTVSTSRDLRALAMSPGLEDIMSEHMSAPVRTALESRRNALSDSHAGSRGIDSYVEVLAEHEAEWARRWESSDIEIEGDPESQLAARVAIFHLLRAHVPGDPRVAIDAKGYAGEAYWGRYFWDTEMYLLPFYLYTRPDAARTLAEFRVHTLAGARRNAARYGYQGARYAWESDASGDECCPNWQYADHEVHVTADVAYGLAHYAAGAGDAAFLRGPAAGVLVETARYWMERITFEDRERLTRPRLLGVMGPDEYKPITNDNAYTNRLVAESLRVAAEHGGAVGGVTDVEREAWRRTAAGLPIPRAEDGVVVMQCEGFDRFADPEFARHWKDRDAGSTFAAQVSQERLYRSKCLKQADVLMLMALFPGDFSDEEVRRAWDYYLPYTTHDSSLSAGAHCLVACRLGMDDEAWAFWRRGSRQDLPVADGGEGGTAEGIHIAGAGAVWMMAVLGFAGLRTALQAEELTLAPRLPKAWTALRFPLVWKGQAVRVEIERGRTVITNRSDRALAAIVSGVRRTIAPGKAEVFA